ncbi:LPS assembly protein LptD [Shewanella oneidensis MR-1]|uniref:LPS-assembly protein LptD n=1 Tax=Shewanella oneidensis (strain ATCC 700550 / JCM 31522 / CIP 106686 / LMG 19005 / NCIMB 14063 / MR-1) TaxID=211586 RepID=LPTD_SHEON|nr:LPS assembly protein LptD [Shewanella oneidensis]Q8EB96.1 RecName: Full=LPS-assembly protein LptD; Flags: Precursor [Shewanella oneidensis MR-1]AAN56622.1 lipopolysaccharide export porin LptD [Shewanella oneidensis MR-1]MDX5998987.1 LPS assembly protein LptD [Shewanella oneidensis]MEE2027485.1 LPS-assembly protein LptD [Shewanella oneidensis]QKG97984.1 LPS assembly protein LptD [Shewanella oneidensis MR-1]
MQIRYLLALSLLPKLVLADESPATSASQCLIEPPVPRIVSQPGLSAADQAKIRIASDRSKAEMGKQAIFTGDVVFSQGDRHIAADEAILDQATEQFDANGNLVFQDSNFTVTADSLQAQMRSNRATLTGAQYWLHGQQVHGDAEKLQITINNNLILTNTNFTTCPPDNVSWLLEAEKIKINSEEEWGEIWNAKLRVADIPVFYIPYMTVPVSDKRKTGFLYPSFSTSTTNGFEVSAPYYWNIAPEYDLTFTPNYMTNRGLFTKTEFRYLAGEAQNGRLNLEYLGSDQMLNGSPNRYLYNWQHQGAIDKNWRVLANFTEVSDNNYFNDLKSDVNRATDNQLSRIGEVSYFERDWDISTRVQDIKVLGEDEKPYQVMPQVNFNYRAADFWNNLDFGFNSELTNFAHQDDDVNTATRLHMAPSLTLPIHGPSGSFTSQLKLMQTNYWQEKNNSKFDSLDDTVSRTIPQVRINGQINFERFTELFEHNYRQTLEPQFQYLYVGYEDQRGIGIYDTAQLQDDYFGLFRDRRFSGLDRIADANQVTLGITTRLFDDHNQEATKFSLGQIFYLQDSKLGYEDNIFEQNQSTSVLAAELDTRLSSNWYLGAAIQYDTNTSDNKKTEVTLDFRPEANKLLQFSYRYVPDLLNSNTNDLVNISQAGVRGAWPINDSLYFVGNWYYDLNETRSIETYTGVQYESCCYAIRLSYHYRIKTNYDDNIGSTIIDEREQFESGVYLNLIIKGLGGSGPLGVSDMLNDGLFNYRKPLYLRN